VWVARYEGLTRAILDGELNDATPLCSRRYDAVLLGWGSLSHVLHPVERSRVLHACTLLAPSGPILASYLATGGEGRALQLGASAGRLLATPFALRHRQPVDPTAALGAWFGFIHLFPPDEIPELARSVGRRLLDYSASPYPHATLVEVTAT